MNRNRNQSNTGSGGRGLIRNGLSVQELKAITAIRVGVAQEIDDGIGLNDPVAPSNIVNSYETATPQQLAVAGLVLRSSNALASVPQPVSFVRQPSSNLARGSPAYSGSNTSDVSINMRKNILSSQRSGGYNDNVRLNDNYLNPGNSQFSASQQTRLLSGSEVVSSNSLSINELKEMTRQRLAYGYPADADIFNAEGTPSQANFAPVQTNTSQNSFNYHADNNLSTVGSGPVSQPGLIRHPQQVFPSPRENNYAPTPSSSLSFHGQTILSDPSTFQGVNMFSRSQNANSMNNFSPQLNVHAQQFQSRNLSARNNEIGSIDGGMMGTSLDRQDSSYYSSISPHVQSYSSTSESASSNMNLTQNSFANGTSSFLPGLSLMSGNYSPRPSTSQMDPIDQANREIARRTMITGASDNYSEPNAFSSGYNNPHGPQYQNFPNDSIDSPADFQREWTGYSQNQTAFQNNSSSLSLPSTHGSNFNSQSQGMQPERNEFLLPRLASPRSLLATGVQATNSPYSRPTSRRLSFIKNSIIGECDNSAFSMGNSHDVNNFDYTFSSYQNRDTQDYVSEKSPRPQSPPLRYRTNSDTNSLAFEIAESVLDSSLGNSPLVKGFKTLTVSPTSSDSGPASKDSPSEFFLSLGSSPMKGMLKRMPSDHGLQTHPLPNSALPTLSRHLSLKSLDRGLALGELNSNADSVHRNDVKSVMFDGWSSGRSEEQGNTYLPSVGGGGGIQNAVSGFNRHSPEGVYDDDDFEFIESENSSDPVSRIIRSRTSSYNMSRSISHYSE